MTPPLDLSPDEAREYLAGLAARGIVVSLDGNALDVAGPVEPIDVEQLEAYAVPLASVLRPLPQPEAHSAVAPQPETGPSAPARPTAPPVLRFEPPVYSVEGRIVTEADVLRMLRELDDDAVGRYQRGDIDRATAYENTRDWMRDYLMLFGSFPRSYND